MSAKNTIPTMAPTDEPARLSLPASMLMLGGRCLVPLLESGIPVGPLWLLETRGRKTGVLRTLPVAVARSGGRRYLVSVYGETGWVANIRASREGTLRRGRRTEAIHVTEITDESRAAVAMQLRKTLWFVPFVRGAFTATPRDGVKAFQAEAWLHPVFAIDTPA